MRPKALGSVLLVFGLTACDDQNAILEADVPIRPIDAELDAAPQDAAPDSHIPDAQLPDQAIDAAVPECEAGVDRRCAGNGVDTCNPDGTWGGVDFVCFPDSVCAEDPDFPDRAGCRFEACEEGARICRDGGIFECLKGELYGFVETCNGRCVDNACIECDMAEAESCNGLDDDCDGIADEGVTPTPCYDGAPGTQDVGLCRSGTSQCVDGAGAACDGQVQPIAEVCNGQDDDCDGATDETFALQHDPANCGQCGRACVIAAGEGVCVDGECDFRCAPGFANCNDDWADGCEREGECGPDVCDGADNDGDGTIDEDFVPTPACGEGVCRAGSTPSACVDGVEQACAPGPPTGDDSTCDGLDDDCDGRVDEGYVANEACGVGACAANPIASRCMAGVEVPCTPRALPGDEACNGLDDDCDGATDEAFDLGLPCVIGQGACAAEGVVHCANGGVACDAAEVPPGVEDCNGLDDDCDGATDEEIAPGEACSSGLGECERQGQLMCSDGRLECSAIAGDARVEVCNGADDDCDGELDEGLVGDPCAQGVGECLNEGALLCIDGSTQCDAVALPPGVEVCNQLDDDCDGALDEGLALRVLWRADVTPPDVTAIAAAVTATDTGAAIYWDATPGDAGVSFINRDGEPERAPVRLDGTRGDLVWTGDEVAVVYDSGPVGGDALQEHRLVRINALGASAPVVLASFRVTYLPAIAWTGAEIALSYYDATAQHTLHVQLHALDGTRSGARLTPQPANVSKHPDIAWRGERGAVAWRSGGDSAGTQKRVWLGRLQRDADGSPVLTDPPRFLGRIGDFVARNGVGSQPSVAVAPDGYAATWVNEIDADSARIMLGLYDAQGDPLGAPRSMGSDQVAPPAGPIVYAPERDAWTLTWAEGEAGSRVVRAGVLSRAGAWIEGPIDVSEAGEDAWRPALAWDGADLWVTWEDATDGSTIRLARIGLSCAPAIECDSIQREACDGADDDCDGRLDEGSNAELPVSAGVGHAPEIEWTGSEYFVAWRNVELNTPRSPREARAGLIDRTGARVGEELLIDGSEFLGTPALVRTDDSIAVAWHSYDGPAARVLVREWQAGALTPPRRYGPDGFLPDITWADGLVAVWYRQDNPDETLVVDQVDAEQQGDAHALTNENRVDRLASIVPVDGGFAVAWQEGASMQHNAKYVRLMLLGEDQRQRTDSRRVAGMGTFTSPYSTEPRPALASRGSAVGVTWVAKTDLGQAVRFQQFSAVDGADLMPALTISEGPGVNFDRADVKWLPEVRQWAVVWSEAAEGPRDAGESEVHLALITAQGVLVERRQISHARGESRQPALGWDGESLGVAYSDDRDGTRRIWFTRVQLACGPECGPDEVRDARGLCVAIQPGACVPERAIAEVCNGVDDDCDGLIDEGDSTHPAVLIDEAAAIGGSLVAWGDGELALAWYGSAPGVQMMRLNAAGMPDSVPVSMAGFDDVRPRTLSAARSPDGTFGVVSPHTNGARDRWRLGFYGVEADLSAGRDVVNLGEGRWEGEGHLAPRDGGFWSLSKPGDLSRLTLTALDTDGGIVGEPTRIANGPLRGEHMIRAGDGVAVVWENSASGHGRFVRLNAQGDIVAGPVDFAQNEVVYSALATDGERFLIAYGGPVPRQLFMTLVDAAGQPIIAPRRVPGVEGGRDPQVYWTGSAYTVFYRAGAKNALHLVVFDRDGQVIREPEQLIEPQGRTGQSFSARLTGRDIAVSWTDVLDGGNRQYVRRLTRACPAIE